MSKASVPWGGGTEGGNDAVIHTRVLWEAGACILQGRKLVPSELEEEGKPGLFVWFSCPSCSAAQEARGESTRSLPPGCCQYCVEKNS